MLHNRRDNEDAKENDFDDLKQELNMAKYEMIKDVKQIKQNLNAYETIFHRGLVVMGQYFFKKDDEYSETSQNYEKFVSTGTIDFEELRDPFDNEAIDGTTSK